MGLKGIVSPKLEGDEQQRHLVPAQKDQPTGLQIHFCGSSFVWLAFLMPGRGPEELLQINVRQARLGES